MLDESTPLSERELEILALVSTGATNQQIARELVISTNTVKVHLRNIYAKLEVSSRTEATMVAVRQGWVAVPRSGDEATPGETEVAEAVEAASPVAAETLTPFQVPLVKRISLVVAIVMAGMLLWLPQIVQTRANGAVPGPVEGVFPTPTAVIDSANDRWRTQAQMPTPRNGLAVVAREGAIYAIGGIDSDGVTGKVEVFDPKTEAWTSRRAKPTPVGFVSAAVVDDKIYVPGGVGDGQVYQSVLEVYDPVRDVWQTRAPMPEAVGAYGLAVFEDSIYLFGGFNGQDYVASVYRYDTANDRWEALKSMAVARGFLSAATLDGQIYVMGGFDGAAEFDACDTYDPGTDSWAPRAPMQLARGGMASVAVRNNLYAIGGGMQGYLPFNERYDPRADAWTRITTPVSEEWWGLGAAFVGANVYAIGGWSSGNLGVNEAYKALYQQFIILP